MREWPALCKEGWKHPRRAQMAAPSALQRLSGLCSGDGPTSWQWQRKQTSAEAAAMGTVRALLTVIGTTVQRMGTARALLVLQRVHIQ